MQYTNPTSKDVDQAEAEIRHDYAIYGRATVSLSRITKKRCEEIAATLDNCELVEGSNGVVEFSKIGPRDSGCAPPTTPLPTGWKCNALPQAS